MAKKEFIFQGITTRTHKDAIREAFEVSSVQSVLISVAYLTESGVEPLEDLFTEHAQVLKIFAGIRNDVTSYQGLSRLHNIPNGKIYAVDTGSRTVVFHPKLFLVRGKDEARLVLGSANLTLGGINNNIEAGMLVKFDVNCADDKAIVDEIEKQLQKLPVDYVEHVLLIDNMTKLDGLLATGRLVDEMALTPSRSSISGNGNESDPMPRMKLKTTPMHRKLRSAQSATAPSVAVAINNPAATTPLVAGFNLELVWESKALTERDLNIPKGTKTNKTGSINLDKGMLPEAEDHRPYFRTKVFNALNWTYRSPTVDEAYGLFQLILKGVNYGQFDLVVRHTNSTTSKSYLQNNAMSRLSWGPMKNYIADQSLIGRTLALYRDKSDPTHFVLEID